MIRKIGIVSFAAYALLITYLSLAPEPDMPTVGNDKLSHLLAYAGFATLAIGLFLSRRNYLFACLGIVAYSGLMEVVQHFIPGREMSALDLLANTAGVVLVLVVTRFAPWPVGQVTPD